MERLLNCQTSTVLNQQIRFFKTITIVAEPQSGWSTIYDFYEAAFRGPHLIPRELQPHGLTGTD